MFPLHARHPIIITVLLLCSALGICIGLYVWRAETSNEVAGTIVGIPAQMEDDAVSVRDENPFSYLISYTDEGFEPAEVSIRAGETVRFTNNSSQDMLWVAAISGEASGVYPAVEETCGQSSLDTCKTIEKGRYWQFTFEKTGEWKFRNNANTSHTGTVKAQTI